jgi:hypothetical protein
MLMRWSWAEERECDDGSHGAAPLSNCLGLGAREVQGWRVGAEAAAGDWNWSGDWMAFLNYSVM